jgi:two-component system, NtrC family, response regulator AtoC
VARIVIIDDEAPLVHSLQLELMDLGHECRCAHTAADGQALVERQEPDLAIVDLMLPDGDGIDLIRRFRAEDRRFPIVVLTAFASIPSAVNAMREGAVDYLEKPIDLERLQFILQRNLEAERLRGRVELYERMLPDGHCVPEIIGESDTLCRALDLARRIAAPGVEQAGAMPTILITGETGTGKDLLARFIHTFGPLRGQPLVHVDCAALPRELVESELFGHERGAFTDAKRTKRGLLEMAAGGTVFLNEIGELAWEVQGKLLTTLEGQSFRRLGGTRDLPVDVRILAATNADLEARVAERTFRADLFQRLNGFRIHLPPLRERGDDILRLADYFGARMARKYRRPPPVLSAALREVLLDYAWPGNVRELAHVMQRATLLQENGCLGAEHLGLARFVPSAADAPGGEPDAGHIADVMQQTHGNVAHAARLLGVSRTTLRRWLVSVRRTTSLIL